MRKILSIMRKYVLIVALFGVLSSVSAQQLPDSHFENWGDKFNGDKQLTEWHGSNVNQAGFKFTFMYQKPGRTGFSAYVTDRAVGIPKLGIGAIGPAELLRERKAVSPGNTVLTRWLYGSNV